MSRRAVLTGMASLPAVSCFPADERGAAPSTQYRWTRILDEAPYPKSYNYPVHVAPGGRFFALHPRGTWSSTDAVTWTKESLPAVPNNTAYMGVVQHRNASVALGRHQGNYQEFTIDKKVWRTTDYRRWEELDTPSLPGVIFYGCVSFGGFIWILGGFDGRQSVNHIWRSADGKSWDKMPDPPWSPRTQAKSVAFQDRLLVIGGGEIDGEPGSDIIRSEVWSTKDGRAWTKIADHVGQPDPTAYVPQVFDNQLWLVGANRSGAFKSEMIVSPNGQDWTPISAPWSARGGMATWTDGTRMLMTGGKSSHVENGETLFEYSNDVWEMRKV